LIFILALWVHFGHSPADNFGALWRENTPDVLAIFIVLVLASPLDVPFQKQFETNFIAKVFGAHGKLFKCHRKQKRQNRKKKLPTKMPFLIHN